MKKIMLAKYPLFPDLFTSLAFFSFLSRTACPKCFDFDSFALSNVLYIMYICHYISLLHANSEYIFSFLDLQKAGSLCSKYKLVGTNILMPSRQVQYKSTCA